MARPRDYDFFSNEEERALGCLRNLNIGCRKVEAELPDFACLYNSNRIDFAVEGVRCNGRQEANTVRDAFKAITGFADLVSKMSNETTLLAIRLQKIKAKAEHVMRHLKDCPDCKGRKGTGRNGGTPPWEDCGSCNGAGMIPVAIEEVG